MIYLLHLGGFVYTRHILFSSIEGTLRKAGTPLPGVLIKRMTYFNFQEVVLEETSITDENGKFFFPKIEKTLLLTLPHEPRIRQDIYIDDQKLANEFGRDFFIRPKQQVKLINLWMFDKNDYELDSEFKNLLNKPLHCDLENSIGNVYPADPQKEWLAVPKGKCRIQD